MYVGIGSPSSPDDRRFRNPLFSSSASPKKRSLRPCTAQRQSTPPVAPHTTNGITRSAPLNRISILSPLWIFFLFLQGWFLSYPIPCSFVFSAKSISHFVGAYSTPGFKTGVGHLHMINPLSFGSSRERKGCPKRMFDGNGKILRIFQTTYLL